MILLKDVARTLHLSDATLRQYIQKGYIKAIKIGHQWFFDEQEFARLKEKYKKGKSINYVRKENVSYRQYHRWLCDKYGNASKCMNVSCPNLSTAYDYALIKGREHKKDKSHYLELCRSCHKKYDNGDLVVVTVDSI